MTKLKERYRKKLRQTEKIENKVKKQEYERERKGEMRKVKMTLIVNACACQHCVT